MDAFSWLLKYLTKRGHTHSNGTASHFGSQYLCPNLSSCTVHCKSNNLVQSLTARSTRAICIAMRFSWAMQNGKIINLKNFHPANLLTFRIFKTHKPVKGINAFHKDREEVFYALNHCIEFSASDTVIAFRSSK